MICPSCGTQNDDNNFKCVPCGRVLHPAAPVRPQVPVDNTMGGLIPLKNSKALVAYYLGIFSLIPCIGAPLGIAAFVLGILGLRYAGEHPEAKGKVHAWIGILLGGLCGLGYTLLFVLPYLLR